MVNYYRELPENYKEVFSIDAKEKKTSILITVFSLVITIAPLLVIALFSDVSAIVRAIKASSLTVPYLVLLASLIIYIVLHELVHGAAYKCLTHQKLTFGITLAVAFCGVPDIYTSRKTALISLTAPLTVFSIVFLALMLYFKSVSLVYFAIFAIVFSIHLGDCVGDLYMTILLLTKFTDPRLLMKDTGPAQSLYLPE